MKKYRLSKYNPLYRDELGAFQKEEWTSCSDIGNWYDGDELKKEQYLAVESKYCEAILKILEINKVERMVIADLENYNSKVAIDNIFKNIGVNMSDEYASIISTLRNDKVIERKRISKYIKMLLRECFWCRLIGCDSLCKIEFGYDYYVYVQCENVPSSIIDLY